jgi:putative addiction module killer protein
MTCSLNNIEVTEKSLKVCIDQNGHIAFADWIRALRDERARQKIQARLARVRLGNFGVVRPIGQGLSELVIDYGPGYRIYLGQTGGEIAILLIGGDKSTLSIPLFLDRCNSLAVRKWQDVFPEASLASQFILV